VGVARAAHLVLLGELEAVVGLQPLRVLRHVRDRNGGVAEHACREQSRGVAVTWQPAGQGREFMV
jgi:hypothetical protein